MIIFDSLILPNTLYSMIHHLCSEHCFIRPVRTQNITVSKGVRGKGESGYFAVYVYSVFMCTWRCCESESVIWRLWVWHFQVCCLIRTLLHMNDPPLTHHECTMHWMFSLSLSLSFFVSLTHTHTPERQDALTFSVIHYGRHCCHVELHYIAEDVLQQWCNDALNTTD